MHWAIAALVTAILIVGALLVSTTSSSYLSLLGLHKVLGVTLFILMLVRVGLRIHFGNPRHEKALPTLVSLAASLSHLAFYLILLAMPVIGYLMLCAAGNPVTFGAITLPTIIAKSDSAYVVFHSLHLALALALFIIVLAHLTAALYHHVIRQDGVLRRML